MKLIQGTVGRMIEFGGISHFFHSVWETSKLNRGGGKCEGESHQKTFYFSKLLEEMKIPITAERYFGMK